MFTFAIVPLALAASALATVFITSPTSSTTCVAGQNCIVSWIDGGGSSSLADFGLADFSVYVGNAKQQTPLQTIATSVNVSGTSQVTFKLDGTIGPDSNEYFVRATSKTLKDSGNPQYYAECFSGKFSASGMGGTFNSSLQAEINGQSTAPLATPTDSSGNGTSAMSGMTTMAGMTGTMSMSMATSMSTSTAAASNGAGKPVMATGVVALVAALVGAALL